jgi:hypothetical protein
VHLAATLERGVSPDRGRLSVVISRSNRDPGIHPAKGEALLRAPQGLRTVVTSPTAEAIKLPAPRGYAKSPVFGRFRSQPRWYPGS